MATEFLFDFHLGGVEDKSLLAFQKGSPHLLKLLGDNGQHLNIDTIELIKTRPASLLAQSGEETRHHDVIDLI
jgi:hypothetical protein